MKNLPEPDWIALSESAKRAKRAFSAEQSAVKAALIAAFHNGNIRTRGRFRLYFENDQRHDLPRSVWDRAVVHWRLNKFFIPSDQLGPKMYLVRDVDVCREDLEKWINSDMPDSQQAAHEPAEDLTPEPSDKEKKPQAKRKRDVGADAALKTRIKSVLAMARRIWPKPKKRPGISVMAKELGRLHRKELSYKFETIRKILKCTYSVSVRLGIRGL